jgi:hypothetical protein
VPSIRVAVDGVPVACVATDGLHVLSLHVGGTMVTDEFASVELHGGSYPEKGESTHLTWVSDLELRPGQQVQVEFVTKGFTSHAGKTIEELFPGESHPEESLQKNLTSLVEELRSKPRLRSHYSFEVQSSLGSNVTCELPGGAHGFGFSLVWNWVHPERVSASHERWAARIPVPGAPSSGQQRGATR